ncbi:MAG TPA: SUF system Fe-S cluster assembly protein [Vicinamibacterales bacterium]|nr:SUF system Fe-S cluster assembly protein [Vicinamibacterales bacterium]
MKQLPIVPEPPPDPPAGGESVAALEPDPLRTLELRPKIVEALSTVYDPEIPVNIYELGLVYDIVVDRRSVVGVRMTLTAPACPAAQTLPGEVREKIRAIPGVADAIVEIVWDPPWTKDRMSEAAKLQLGLW